MQAHTAASLTHVVRRYGEKLTLDGLTLGIAAGQGTALLGPNGAGGSTASAPLRQLTRAASGAVRGPDGAGCFALARRRRGGGTALRRAVSFATA